MFTSVFADACGEYDSVYTVHLSDVSADVETNLLGENLQSQGCSFVTFGNCFLQVSEVAGNAGNTQYTGLLVENLVGSAEADFLSV